MHCSKFTVLFIKIIYLPLIRTYGNRRFNFRYIAGRLNVVSSTESKGIATFVGTFALPSLIFVSLARLDFTTVNWTFLLAILLAKGVIFLGVIVVTVSVSKPIHFGRAGIFAIFCTQSNDFALGYPISEFIFLCVQIYKLFKLNTNFYDIFQSMLFMKEHIRNMLSTYI